MKNASAGDSDRVSARVEFDIAEKPMYDYALAPCGFMYNRTLYKAKPGDVIEDYDGHRARICAVGKLRMNLKTTDMLFRMRYGEPAMRKMREWKRDAVLFGNRRSAVSDEECLFITYERIYENKSEIRRKARGAE